MPDTLEQINLTEALSFNQQAENISKAFRSFLRPSQDSEDDVWPWDIHVFEDSIVFSLGDKLWKANITGTTEDGDPIFDSREDWVRVEWQPIELESIEESYFDSLFAEFQDAAIEVANGDSRYLDINLIKPGWGNQRDKNWYGEDVLRRDAHKFLGVKMYEVNHDDTARTNRTWVSTITEAGDRFADDGSPIVQAFIHDDDFRQRAENLEEGGLLSALQNSIVALGQRIPGTKEGREGYIVTEISDPKYVDFVPKAGAGGHALALYTELDPESLIDLELLTLKQNRPDLVQLIQEEVRKIPRNKPKEVTMGDLQTSTKFKEVEEERDGAILALNEARLVSAKTLIETSQLPAEAKARVTIQLEKTTLTEGYAKEVSGFIQTETEYIAALTGKGNVADLSESEEQASLQKPEKEVIGLTEAEEKKALATFDERYG